LYFNIYNKTI